MGGEKNKTNSRKRTRLGKRKVDTVHLTRSSTEKNEASVEEYCLGKTKQKDLKKVKKGRKIPNQPGPTHQDDRLEEMRGTLIKK